MTTVSYNPSTHRVGMVDIGLEQMIQSLQRLLHLRYPAKDSSEDEELNFWARLVDEIFHKMSADPCSGRQWEWLKQFFYFVQVSGGLSENPFIEFELGFLADQDEKQEVRSLSISWRPRDIEVEWTWKFFEKERVASVRWEWLREVGDEESRRRIVWVLVGE